MTVGAEGAHATVLGIGAFDAFGPMRASARDVEYVGGDNGFTGGHVAVQGNRLLWTFGPDQVDGESHNGDIVDERRLYLPSGGTKEQGLRIYDLAPMLESPVHDPSAPKNLFRGDPVALWETSPYRSKPEPVGARFTHTHDITVYTDYEVEGLGKRDIALLAEGGSYAGDGNTGSIFVIDIIDPDAPVVLLRWLHETDPDTIRSAITTRRSSSTATRVSCSWPTRTCTTAAAAPVA